VVATAVMSTHKAIVLVLYEEGNLVSGHWIQQSIINRPLSTTKTLNLKVKLDWIISIHGRNNSVFEFH
jgi:hypothetical protein